MPNDAIPLILDSELEQVLCFDRADAEGKCWPGVKRIAADLRLSRRTAQRALADLERAGYLRRDGRYRANGSRTSNLYTRRSKRREKTCNPAKSVVYY